MIEHNLNEGKKLAIRMMQLWDNILEQDGINAEIEYRIRKLRTRLEPIIDKMYVKTVKAAETITLCCTKTNELMEHSFDNPSDIYRQLTELENIFDDLMKKTYEFRIKAG